jgi:fatty acid desaturase|tara:strand:+ start:473 stop:1474 length:1002 start_codon:yes stop_codon:yes gene_type:complete
MNVDLDKWYRCNIDKEHLKEFSKKSDLKGIQHVSLFFGLLFLTGYCAYLTWGSWWSLFWFLVYGNVYNFANAMWHETGHKTAFKTKSINEIFYYISSYMAFFEPLRWRYTHFIHHGNTYSTENPYDHEIEFDNNLKKTPTRMLINIIPFADIFFLKQHISYEIIKHALGIETKVMRESIPENAKSKCIFISRLYICIWLFIIIFSFLINSWLPIIYFILPIFYGKTLHKIVAFTQHAGMARDVKDHRLSSRDMRLNPILSFLYWKMEYHCVHHIFPTIPSYNLDKVHDHLKDQLPQIKNGLINTYKEIIPALIKQTQDSKHSIDVEIPVNNFN